MKRWKKTTNEKIRILIIWSLIGECWKLVELSVKKLEKEYRVSPRCETWKKKESWRVSASSLVTASRRENGWFVSTIEARSSTLLYRQRKSSFVSKSYFSSSQIRRRERSSLSTNLFSDVKLRNSPKYQRKSLNQRIDRVERTETGFIESLTDSQINRHISLAKVFMSKFARFKWPKKKSMRRSEFVSRWKREPSWMISWTVVASKVWFVDKLFKRNNISGCSWVPLSFLSVSLALQIPRKRLFVWTEKKSKMSIRFVEFRGRRETFPFVVFTCLRTSSRGRDKERKCQFDE